MDAMKSPRYFITIGCILFASLSKAEEKAGPTGAGQVPSKDGKKGEPVDVRVLFEKGLASDALPEGMVIRLGACLGGPAEKGSGNRVPNELRENWEFTANQVRRIVPGEEDKDSRAESRSIDSKDLCKVLLDGKAIEIRPERRERRWHCSMGRLCNSMSSCETRAKPRCASFQTLLDVPRSGVGERFR
ncbi:MAG: hypothetical protein ABL878_20620 [Burkholderiales bacterium]